MLAGLLLLYSPHAPEGHFPQFPQGEIVVKATQAPLDRGNDERFEWGSAQSFGDPTQDGVPDRVLGGSYFPQPNQGLPRLFTTDIYVRPDASLRLESPVLAHAGSHDFALLSDPGGLRILMPSTTLAHGSAWTLHTLPGGELVQQVFAPTGLGPGIPDPMFLDQFQPSGDLDGDGVDDVFWASSGATGWAYFGSLNGSIWQSRWTHAEQGDALIAIPHEAESHPDIDGDGTSDILVGVNRFSPSLERSWFLLSGADGSEVWRETAAGMGGIPVVGQDIDSDGTVDGTVDGVLWESTGIRAISLLDGREIWATPWSVLDQAVPPGWTYFVDFGERAFSSGLPGGPEDTLLVPLFMLEGGSQDLAFSLASFSLQDGDLLEILEFPEDLAPWDPGIALNGIGHELTSFFPWPHGDIDRDGFMEYSITVKDAANSPAWALQGGNPQPSHRLVILGQRTLWSPETHDVMSLFPVTFDLLCPTGAGKDFVLLLSTAFSEHDGLTLGPWRTNLAPSRALDLTLSTRFLSGTLDQDGLGQTMATLPLNPVLIGQSLYSRGLILNPPGSEEAIWSMTSLSTTELQ